MFLHLDWNPAVLNLIDWTGFGKPLTFSHVTTHTVLETKGTGLQAQRQDFCKTRIWESYKNSAALKLPKSTMASIIMNWKTFGTTRTLPRVGLMAKLRNRWRRVLRRELTKNLTELQRSRVEMGFRRTTVTAAPHRYGLYGRVAVWKLLLSAKQTTTHSEFTKKHLKYSQTVRKELVWSDFFPVDIQWLHF